MLGRLGKKKFIESGERLASRIRVNICGGVAGSRNLGFGN
jgi:hypothetical protein